MVGWGDAPCGFEEEDDATGEGTVNDVGGRAGALGGCIGESVPFVE
jgi:hypothetical protein